MLDIVHPIVQEGTDMVNSWGGVQRNRTNWELLVEWGFSQCL